MPSIAAVVATHNRPEFLEKRSLASIVLQTRPPDYLVVVDDSDMETRSANAGIVARLVLPRTRAFYLENRRTPGASGAWNTALSHLQEVDQSVFIAVLDDDDGWTPTYLEECERAVVERDLDMVASGLVFIRSRGSDGDLLDPPGSLNARDLMVRNTHIQGSNLFVRLRKLIEAGGFDEAMTSTTDRDICIRLADLGTVKYGALNEHLVHHFADNDRPRLSRPGGDAKRSGLTHFLPQVPGPDVRGARCCFFSSAAGGCLTATQPRRYRCLPLLYRFPVGMLPMAPWFWWPDQLHLPKPASSRDSWTLWSRKSPRARKSH